MIPDDKPPPEVDAVAWSMVTSAPSQALAGRSPLWVRIVATLGVIVGTAVALFGFFWPRSADLPWGGDHRYGLFGQRLPSIWTCSDGHQHYSIPFWMGGLAVLLVTAVFFRIFGRRRA